MSRETPPLTDQETAIAQGAVPYAATMREVAGEAPPPLEGEEWLSEPDMLPRRPRRRLLAPLPLSLLGVLLIALGFIGGVLVEKSESSSSSPAAAGSSALTSRFRALAGGRSAASTGAASSSTAAGASGFARPTVGTVAYLEGGTLYVTNSEGNTVKVTTSPGTGVTKSVKSTVPDIHPGETVTITGASSSGGVVTAESITVGASGTSAFSGLFGGSGSGAGGSGAAGSGTTTSGASTGGQSLFGNGG